MEADAGLVFGSFVCIDLPLFILCFKNDWHQFCFFFSHNAQKDFWWHCGPSIDWGGGRLWPCVSSSSLCASFHCMVVLGGNVNTGPNVKHDLANPPFVTYSSVVLQSIHDSADIHRQSLHRGRISGCLRVHSGGEMSSADQYLRKVSQHRDGPLNILCHLL